MVKCPYCDKNDALVALSTYFDIDENLKADYEKHGVQFACKRCERTFDKIYYSIEK